MAQCKTLVSFGNVKTGFGFRPCGQCIPCRINDTRAWYVRSRFELKKIERPFHYFLTLTYNDENLPPDGVCVKKHLKSFLNHLNTAYGLKMRYYATSDYGSINNRAHYHAIILSERKILQSHVEKIWKKGFAYLKTLNNNSLKYTLRYTVKKRPMPNNDKAFFRLISKGWGNNVKDFYCGQDYFEFDGRKYGISRYLSQKLGLDIDKSYRYDRYRDLVQFSSDAKFRGTEQSFDMADIEYLQTLRRLK